MAFVPAAFECLRLAVARQRESLEIIHTRDTASAEYLEILRRNGSIPICSLQDGHKHLPVLSMMT